MPRSESRLRCEVWRNPDWRNLSPKAQWLYMLLLSQPDVSMCGVLPLVEGRWSSLSIGATAETVSAALDELHEHRFLVVDRETFEVLIRTFVKHDGVLRGPKTRAAMWKALAGVASDNLRSSVVVQVVSSLAAEDMDHDLSKGYVTTDFLAANTPPDTPSHTPSHTPSDTPSHGSSSGRATTRNTPPDRSGTSNLQPSTTTDSTPLASGKPTRDELFEALVEVSGWSLDTLTKTARGRVNAAAKELRELGATAGQVRQVARDYRRTYDTEVTPQAVTGNWSRFAKSAAASDPGCPKCGGSMSPHDDLLCRSVAGAA